MGNDNKIAKKDNKLAKIDSKEIKKDEASERRNEVRLFLEDEVHSLAAEKPVTYNLEQEYAKTAKNKNHFILFLMLGCFVFAGLITFGITKYVEYKNSMISVNIDVFNDLNLRNLLDIVSQTRGAYDEAVKSKSELEAALQYGLEKAEQRRSADLFALNSLNLTNKTEYNRRLSAITVEYNNTVNDLHDEYDVKINAQEKLVAQYQGQLAEFDSNAVEQAQAQEAAVDSTKRRYEMEKIKLQESYEREIESLRKQLSSAQNESTEWQLQTVNSLTQKYQDEIDSLDPIIKNKDELILNTHPEEEMDVYDAEYYLEDITEQASNEFTDAFDSAASAYADFTEAYDIVASVPQKFSIPSFVKAMNYYANQAGIVLAEASVAEINRFATIVDGYKSNLSDLNEQLRLLNADFTDTKSRLNQEIEFLNEVITSYESDVEDLNEEIEGHLETIAERENTIADQENTIAEYEDTIAAHENTIAERDDTIAANNQKITEQENTIAARNNTIAERDNTIAEHENTIAERNGTISDLTKKLDDNEKLLQRNEKQREDLTSRNNRYEKINGSYIDYFESQCTLNKWTGLLMELPTASKSTVKVYLTKPYQKQVNGKKNVPALIKRKNSKITTGTLSEVDGIYYFKMDTPEHFKKVKNGDQIGFPQ